MTLSVYYYTTRIIVHQYLKPRKYKLLPRDQITVFKLSICTLLPSYSIRITVFINCKPPKAIQLTQLDYRVNITYCLVLASTLDRSNTTRPLSFNLCTMTGSLRIKVCRTH